MSDDRRYTSQDETLAASELVQKSAMLPWLRWQQQFDLPAPDGLSKL